MSRADRLEDDRFITVFNILAPENDQDTAEDLALCILCALERIDL